MATKTFKRRTCAPTKSEKYWINYKNGGYSTCIAIDKASGFTLSNCVGYAQGRFREINGDKNVWSDTGNWLAGDAETFYSRAKEHGMKVGATPKLGAIICWSKGKVGISSDGAGHVAVVEKIEANGDILTSNSAYGGTLWYEKLITKASGYVYGAGYKFEGFIYPNDEYVEPTVKTTAIKVAKSSISIEVGKTFQTETTITPKNSTEKVTYASSNTSVATVSSTGLIKGIKKGSATITVKSGTKSATLKVTVKSASTNTTTVDYTKNTITDRFKVKLNGVQKAAYTNYNYAVEYCNSIGGVIIDSKTNKQIYPSTTTTSYKTITTIKGDTLWSLAVKYLNDGNRYTEIKKLNRLKTDTLSIGQKLKIPTK